jgi:RNA polymerase sigma-70 factor (ECF subfamily)
MVGATALAQNAPGIGLETALVARARAGDTPAFEEIYRRYERRIYNTVLQVVRNEEDAADITQEAFVRAYRSLRNLRSDEAFVSWLFRIAINLSRNHLRSRPHFRIDSLDEFATSEDDEQELQIPDSTHDPARNAETREMQDVVRRAVGALSDAHREVITLHHLQGMRVDDIATILNCSVGTVKSRLSRARDELKRRLRSYVEE